MWKIQKFHIFEKTEDKTRNFWVLLFTICLLIKNIISCDYVVKFNLSYLYSKANK